MANKSTTDPTGSLATVTLPLQSGASPRLSFDLTAKEQMAIGSAHVQWAYLEHLVMEVTIAIAKAIELTVPEAARQDSFRRRLAAFRSVVSNMAEHPHKTLFLKLADRITNANGFRQKLAHGIWSYGMADAEILHVEVSRSGKGPTDHYNADRIMQFANEVGELSFQLRYPDGEDQFYMERAAEGLSFSRDFVRMMQGKPSGLDHLLGDGGDNLTQELGGE
ncbi:MAG: hypothetical protein E5Y31_20985 [Mesorhizobium sp.]|nr:MAG: hypothetical protein E5Y31_20985 [Mesorhizobium sp.]